MQNRGEPVSVTLEWEDLLIVRWSLDFLQRRLGVEENRAPSIDSERRDVLRVLGTVQQLIDTAMNVQRL